MTFTVQHLIKRGGVWQYRRVIPPGLRQFLGGKVEWKVSLKTGDAHAAQLAWRVVHAKVEQELKDAKQGIAPTVSAYRALEDWRAEQAIRPETARHAEGLNLHLTSLLEDADPDIAMERGVRVSELTPDRRAAVEALLSRHYQSNAEDNPPLSVLYDRYLAERRALPAKTVTEWRSIQKRFTASLGGDKAVRGITQGDVRRFKDKLLSTNLNPKTVRKLLHGLSAVLSWGQKQGYVVTNPALGIASLGTTKGSLGAHDEDKRLPFTAQQARTILEKLPASGELRWLWLVALYSGMRLAEITGLRKQDVQEVDGILCFNVRAHEGRRLKNAASARLVPIHSAILAAGFSANVLPFTKPSASYSRLVNKWLRTTAGIKDKRLLFHSTRHTVKDAMRAARIPEAESRAIMGHGSTGVADSYGLGYPMAVLKKAMDEVRYEH